MAIDGGCIFDLFGENERNISQRRMMIMKKVMVLAIVLMFSAGAAMAYPENAVQNQASEHAQAMKEKAAEKQQAAEEKAQEMQEKATEKQEAAQQKALEKKEKAAEKQEAAQEKAQEKQEKALMKKEKAKEKTKSAPKKGGAMLMGC
jgi:Skp family chaperone for outer membrane proteins